jgi:hypothetical protein
LLLAARQVTAQRDVIRQTLERAVRDLTGLRIAGLAQGRDVAARIHALLDANGLRVVCPQCERPAILRCQSTRGGAVFVFDHTLASGRTFHGGTAQLPPLRLVPKPARKAK